MSKPGSGNELLKHFDADAAARIAALLNKGAITADHVKEIIRLTSASPEYRDPDDFESLLEDAEEMDASAFRAWVDQLLKDEKE